MSIDHPPMRAAQKYVARRIIQQKKVAVWLDMGMGKTRATLSAISALFLLGKVKRVLILAPPLVAEETWPAEIEKWGVAQTYRNIEGSPDERRRILRDDQSDIHIMSRDLIKWMWLQIPADSFPYDMIVFDESSRLGNQSNIAFKALAKVYALCPRLVQLTGTPAGNGYQKLWSQAYLLDRGKALFRAEYLYLKKYFERGYDGYSLKLKEGAKEVIQKKLKPLTVTLRAKDHVDMPTVIYTDKKFTLPAKAAHHYKDMANKYLMELRQGKIEAVNAGIKMNKLLQITGGGVYSEPDADGKTEPYELHLERIAALDEIVEESGDTPLLITYYYKFQLKQLQRKYPHAEKYVKKRNTSARWNAGEIPMLLIHPESVGYGLNLQFGGNILIWFGLTWSLDDFLQTNARIARPGQDKLVRVFQIAARGTADEYLFSRIVDKDATQENLLDSLRAVLEMSK